jgi:hypothetical protein
MAPTNPPFSAIYYLLSAICYLLSAICYLLFAICYSGGGSAEFGQDFGV